MPVIRIHLEHEELSAIRRRAEELGVNVEKFVYGAINCSMSHCLEPLCKVRVGHAVHGPGRDLPLWSDSARSVAAYEGLNDVSQGPGRRADPYRGKPAPAFATSGRGFLGWKRTAHVHPDSPSPSSGRSLRIRLRRIGRG